MINSQSVLISELNPNFTQAQRNAIDEVESVFRISQDSLLRLMNAVEDEMRMCLGTSDNPKKEGLKEIPSFVTGHPTGYEKGTYFSIELIGLDVYLCQVTLRGEGGKLAIRQYQYRIPENLTAGDDIGVLTGYVAECVGDFLERVDASPNITYHMGISSASVHQTDLNTGTITQLEPCLNYSSAIGTDVIHLLQEHIDAKGLPVKIVAIANDAACALLANAYKNPHTRVGIAHSSGTNCAYYDKASNIQKLLAGRKNNAPSNSDMIINTEWCNLDSRSLPVTSFDVQVDEQSVNKGLRIIEKMTSGMYLGEIVRLILNQFSNLGIFSFEMGQNCLLRKPYQFDTSYIYACETDVDTLDGTKYILEELCGTGETTLIDREIVKKVCGLVGYRAALLIGASLAGVVQYVTSNVISLEQIENRFLVCISGKVYKDYLSFHPRVCETLKSLIPSQISSDLSVEISTHSSIVGAAILAMLAGSADQAIEYRF